MTLCAYFLLVSLYLSCINMIGIDTRVDTCYFHFSHFLLMCEVSSYSSTSTSDLILMHCCCWSLFLVFLSSSAIISVWHKTVASLLPYCDNPRLVVCIIFCWSWQLLDNVSLHFVVGKSNLLWVRHWPSPFLSSPMLFHVRHNFKHFFVPVAETQSRIEFWNSIIPSK